MLRHILEHGDIVGKDTAGRNIIQLAVDDRTLEQLLTFDAGEAELEAESDGESEDDAEEEGPPALLEVVRPKVLQVRR